MGSSLFKLAELGHALCSVPPRWVNLRPEGRLGSELVALLERKNGFLAFEAALHVFGDCEQGAYPSLHLWNSHDCWRQYYGSLAEGCIFFAQDAFGFQFAIKDDAVWSFDAETGGLTKLADTLEGWAALVLNDYEFQTGYPFIHAWQLEHGSIPANHRLFPRKPFVLGGTFEASNLVLSNAIHGMQFRGFVAQQLKDLPEGTVVQFEFTPPPS